jgi:hypothetical protein
MEMRNGNNVLYQEGDILIFLIKFIFIYFLFQKVEEIGHEIVSGPSGDYFRLLNPGTYTVSVTADGYEKSSQVVNVNNNNKVLSAKIVNFTLEKDSLPEWSALQDFGIEKNLESKYLSNQEISGKLKIISTSMYSGYSIKECSLRG